MQVHDQGVLADALLPCAGPLLAVAAAVADTHAIEIG